MLGIGNHSTGDSEVLVPLKESKKQRSWPLVALVAMHATRYELFTTKDLHSALVEQKEPPSTLLLCTVSAAVLSGASSSGPVLHVPGPRRMAAVYRNLTVKGTG